MYVWSSFYGRPLALRLQDVKARVWARSDLLAWNISMEPVDVVVVYVEFGWAGLGAVSQVVEALLLVDVFPLLWECVRLI